MFPLFASGFVALDIAGTFSIVGIIAGILLLIIWGLTVKNTTALFYDKKKIRATAMFGAPGLILLVVGIFLAATLQPMAAHIYIANYGGKDGKVEIAGESYPIPSESWKRIEIRSREQNFAIKGYLGDEVVFDTIMGTGTYIGNFSEDRIVIAEEVIYSQFSSLANTDDLGYESLESAGIAQFSTDVISDNIYDFDQSSPEQMSVSSSSSEVRAWDLQIMTQQEMLKRMMEALRQEEGGSTLDSLLQSLDTNDSGEVELEEEPLGDD